MKNIRCLNKFFPIAFISVLLLILCSCSDSTLLNGIWEDSNENTITFYSDGYFEACVPTSGDTTEYVGTYGVTGNSIQFLAEGGEVFLSQFSIDGGLLYLTWTPDDETSVNLTLYKTKLAGAYVTDTESASN